MVTAGERGRFVQLGDVRGWDRYAYVRNNPTDRIDPTGHMDCDDEVGSPRDRRDLTRWLVAAAVDSANSPEMQFLRYNNDAFVVTALVSPPLAGVITAGDMIYFKSYVGDGKKYDVKDKIFALLKTDVVILAGEAFEFSTVGNVLYGFYGASAGYDPAMLHTGAGIAQLGDHNRCGSETGDYFYDTEDDYYAIELGILLYEEYYDDGILTEAEFVKALSEFPHKNQLNHKPMPDYKPEEIYYIPQDFYFGFEGLCQ